MITNSEKINLDDCPYSNGIYYSHKLDILIAVNISFSLFYDNLICKVLFGNNIVKTPSGLREGDIESYNFDNNDDVKKFRKKFGNVTLIELGLGSFYYSGMLYTQEEIDSLAS